MGRRARVNSKPEDRPAIHLRIREDGGFEMPRTLEAWLTVLEIHYGLLRAGEVWSRSSRVGIYLSDVPSSAGFGLEPSNGKLERPLGILDLRSRF